MNASPACRVVSAGKDHVRNPVLRPNVPHLASILHDCLVQPVNRVLYNPPSLLPLPLPLPQLNLSPFRLLKGSAASYLPLMLISSCAWLTGAGSAPPSWLGLGRSWTLEGAKSVERAGRVAWRRRSFIIARSSRSALMLRLAK